MYEHIYIYINIHAKYQKSGFLCINIIHRIPNSSRENMNAQILLNSIVYIIHTTVYQYHSSFNQVRKQMLI